jgi:hypothetical protein
MTSWLGGSPLVATEALGEPDVAQPARFGAVGGSREDHADRSGEEAGVRGAEFVGHVDPLARREGGGESDGGAHVDRGREAVVLSVRVEQRQGDQPPVVGAEVRHSRHDLGDGAVVGLGQHDALGLRRGAGREHHGETGVRLDGSRRRAVGRADLGAQASTRFNVRGGLLEGDGPQCTPLRHAAEVGVAAPGGVEADLGSYPAELGLDIAAARRRVDGHHPGAELRGGEPDRDERRGVAQAQMNGVAGGHTVRREQRRGVIDDDVELAVGPCVDLAVLAAEREKCTVSVLVDRALP